jgi:hypothetical protein
MTKIKRNKTEQNSLSVPVPPGGREGRGEADKWINDVLSSVDGIKPVEANPFLYEKILNRMQKAGRMEAVFTRRMIMRLSVGFAILLLINLISLRQYRSGNRSMNQTSLYSEYNFSYNYNY